MCVRHSDRDERGRLLPGHTANPRKRLPPVENFDIDRPEVRQAILAALLEVGRAEEMDDALRALEAGGLEGLIRDQGRGVATAFVQALRLPLSEAGAP